MVSPGAMEDQLILAGLFQAVSQEFPLPETKTEPLTYLVAASALRTVARIPRKSVRALVTVCKAWLPAIIRSEMLAGLRVCSRHKNIFNCSTANGPPPWGK